MEKYNNRPVLVAGAGNIGSAMARGIAAGGCPVVLYNRSEGRLKAFADVQNIECTTDMAQALSRAPWLALVCVETEGVAPLVKAMAANAEAGMIVGSCAAVPSLEQLEAAFGGAVARPRLVRVLPNIAATCGQSVNLLAHKGLDDADLEALHTVLAHTGSTFDVPERLFGPAMALSSCGIAFALRYVRAQTEAAVALGMAPAVAASIAGATLAGTAALIATGEHPEVLTDRVTTPGGLTIRGLNAMENKGFTPAVMAGIVNAVK